MCDACGNEVVQDLRSSTARKMLYETEARWMRARQARCVAGGAVLGVVLYFLSYFGVVYVPMLKVGMWQPVFAFSSALSLSILLERKLGKRRRFPYLDDYEFPSDGEPTREETLNGL